MAEKESSGCAGSDFAGKESSSPTPDLWMLKWLSLHRTDLVDSIQHVVPAILDRLVQKECINSIRSAVYQEIMSDSTVAVQKARKLLDWLCAQPASVFWSFQHAISDCGLSKETADQLAVSDKEIRELSESVKKFSLAEKLALMSCHSVLNAREELVKFYRSRDELTMSSGLAKGTTMSMDKIMVNICLLSSEEAKKAFQDPSFGSERDQRRSEYLYSKILQGGQSFLSLEEVFKAKRQGQKVPHKVMAAGGAGCGKSTCFTRKAPYEWALGRLWEEFALLFCLELRNKSVWKAKTLPELLRLHQLGLSADEQEEVRLFITHNPDKVVIVCDGLDEGLVDKSSMLWSLLQGNCVGVPSTLRLVVTSRPCVTANELSENISYQGVEVVGFSKENVALFAHKYLGKESSKKLLSLLHNQPSVASMMHTPLFCLLICDLFREDQDLPSRRTEIFEKVVVAVLRRYAKARSLKASFREVNKAPPELRELILSMGKVAFEGLQKKQMYFTEEELEEAGLATEALELGFLTKAESSAFQEVDEFTFSHLTLQEFLSALYVISEVLKTGADLPALLQKASLEGDHLSLFWVFVAGLLSGDLVEDLLNTICQGMEKPTLVKRRIFPKSLKLMLCRCFAESCLGRNGSQSASIGKHLTNKGVDLSMEKLSRSDCSALSTVLQCHRTESERLQLLDLTLCFMTDAGLALLLAGLLCCKSIKRFSLAWNSLTSQHMSDIGAVLSNNASTLEFVCLTSNQIGDDGLEALSQSLKRCSALQRLYLSSCSLESRGALILTGVVSSLPRLTLLAYQGNGYSGYDVIKQLRASVRGTVLRL